MLHKDLSFPHAYEIEELPELPGTEKSDISVFYFPQPKNRPEQDGLWLKIKPSNGKPWIGVFAFGYTSLPALSRVVSSPDPNRAFVISRGAAYIVNADAPETWEQISMNPVLDLRLLPEHQLLVVADFTRLIAYGRSGLAWESPRVCWDELKILNVTPDTIEGVGFDPTALGESRFAVHLKTGRSLRPSPVSVDGKPLW